MKKNISLIGRKVYRIGNITINIPSIAELRSDNEEYERAFWQDIGLFTKTPTDMMSELDSLGKDFEKVSDYELFVMLFLVTKSVIKHKCTLFRDFDLYEFNYDPALNAVTDEQHKYIINEDIYNKISDTICAMICRKKTEKKKFGNKFAKKKRIETDREQKQRNAQKSGEGQESVLDSVILRLVNKSDFPYNFQTVNDISIYELLMSLKQIDKEADVDSLLETRLVGNDLSKLPAEKFSRYAL